MIDWFKKLSKEDFREIISFMIITSVFTFMFMIVFVQIWYPLPDNAQRFADIILGYLFGSVLQKVMSFYFPTLPNDKPTKEDAPTS
jgi:uncharacterized BrkB/YihY/UPF0761 family membrane protein